jgi:hypothetical protein
MYMFAYNIYSIIFNILQDVCVCVCVCVCVYVCACVCVIALLMLFGYILWTFYYDLMIPEILSMGMFDASWSLSSI